jgi:alpha-beta hydrolase superfamily lysophospholipase
MPERANSHVCVSPASTLFASASHVPALLICFLRSLLTAALASALLAGPATTASVADECLETPDFRVTGPGHWYYHLDRTLTRKCWHFEQVVTAIAPAPAAPAVATATVAAVDSQASFLSRFTAGLTQTLSAPTPQPQLQQTRQYNTPYLAGETAQTLSPKPAKSAPAVYGERPQTTPVPTTTGAAERHDQTASTEKKEKTDKNEKRDSPHNVAEREALFQDFMKWQLERNVFGRP